MKPSFKTLLLFALAVICLPSYNQVSWEQVTGSWSGKLDAGGVQLRIVFNVFMDEGGAYKATLDSPDQGATGIPMGAVSLKGDTLRIEAPQLMGSYAGNVRPDSTIEGEWSQAGRTFELNLSRQQEAIRLNRPQEPTPPFPYGEEEVSFQNETEGFSLGGTLTIPQGKGPFPAVVLVTGSGSQNRDEELFGHKPFKVIADHLTRQGVVVIRYDDRGVGASGGAYYGSTSEDNAGDARSAFEFLLGRQEVDPSRVGILGHSEGGLIAFMLASEYGDISFIISLAGPGIIGKSILLDQSEYIARMSGVEAAVREANRDLMNEVYDLMVSHKTHEAWAGKVQGYTSDYFSGKGIGDYSEEEVEQIRKSLLASITEASYAWMRFFVMVDPSVFFGKIKCAVLALNGEKDCQVLAQENISAIAEKLSASGNQNVTARILPGLNHLFQNCESGLPAEYGTIEETFDPQTLELISEWIKSL